METTVGIREFKARLSAYLRKVKAGATLVITERGTPVGRILPPAPLLDDRLGTLGEAGLLTWDGERLGAVSPPAKARKGTTVASLLLEDRE